ncbi:hypothetical protein NIES22_31840 [Calothrix brevissima NIES-22]|nr:hypothetical protein NIES22_31840 [Calothrix brevissima NIES-22]
MRDGESHLVGWAMFSLLIINEVGNMNSQPKPNLHELEQFYIEEIETLKKAEGRGQRAEGFV